MKNLIKHFQTIILIAIATPFVSGCASTAQALFHRPVVEDSVGETLHLVSMASDRRSVVVMTSGEKRGLFCAEPPPDSATALATQFGIDAGAEKNQVGNIRLRTDDQTNTGVTVLTHRTPSLEAFRVGLYSLCQFYVNGAFKEQDVKELYKVLIDNFANNIGAEGKRDLPVLSSQTAKTNPSNLHSATSSVANKPEVSTNAEASAKPGSSSK